MKLIRLTFPKEYLANTSSYKWPLKCYMLYIRKGCVSVDQGKADDDTIEVIIGFSDKVGWVMHLKTHCGLMTSHNDRHLSLHWFMVSACCLTTPSHCLAHCWSTNNGILWDSQEWAVSREVPGNPFVRWVWRWPIQNVCQWDNAKKKSTHLSLE